METFQLLYFHGSLLEDAEEVWAGNVLEAIELAFARPPGDIRIEIWSQKGRVGVIGEQRR